MTRRNIIVLALLSGASCSLSCRSAAPITITIADVSSVESTEEITFTLTLSQPNPNDPISVEYTTVDGSAQAASDYVAESGTIDFAVGETTQTLTVDLQNNELAEPSETFKVQLSNAHGAKLTTKSAIGTIVDDDGLPTVSIADGYADEDNGNVVFTLSLSQPTEQIVSVMYATSDDSALAGDDYSTRSGTLTFARIQTEKTLAVPILDDAFDEINEAFKITLSTPAHATIDMGSADGTIFDDDLPVISIDNVSASESDRSATFGVRLDQPNAEVVTVNFATQAGTAIADKDFTAKNGTLNFPVGGSTNQSITVTVIDDETIENDDETLSLQLSNPLHAELGNNLGTATISSDDLYESIVSVGYGHTCARRSNGTMWCWGYNGFGQLGNNEHGAGVHSSLPTQVGSSNNWDEVSAGTNYTCAIDSDGTLSCWGYNYYGQLGIGTSGSGFDKYVPTQVGNAFEWSHISAGTYHTCGTKIDGSLWCWGRNSNGQLGDGSSGDATSKSSPTRVTGGAHWLQISAGTWHSCGIKVTASAWCWGTNLYGELGIGTMGSDADKAVPTLIGTDQDWLSISAGALHTCGTKSNGKILCWGFSAFGQLGLGNSGNKSTPTQIGTSADWSNIDSGVGHTAAVMNDGRLWGWGNNERGEVGDGTWGNSNLRNQPVQVGNTIVWNHADAGGLETCAVDSENSIWCWGDNENGQIGNGTSGVGNKVLAPYHVTFSHN